MGPWTPQLLPKYFRIQENNPKRFQTHISFTDLNIFGNPKQSTNWKVWDTKFPKTIFGGSQTIFNPDRFEYKRKTRWWDLSKSGIIVDNLKTKVNPSKSKNK